MLVLAVMLAACALFGLPGVLIHLNLRARGFGLIPSLGLGVAALVVIFSAAASVAGYSFTLQMGLTLALDAGLLLALRAGGSALPARWWPRLKRWQWLLLVLIAVVYLAPAFLIPVPFDTDAQGFGLLIATARASGSISTLAPFFSQVGWYYSPAYFLFGAQLADMTGTGIHTVMLGFSHLLSLGVIAGIGALGRRLGGRATGWWAMVAAAGGVALFTTLMDSAYTNLLGLWLTTTFLWTLGKALTNGARRDSLLAGMCLSAVLLGHPDSLLHLLLVYILFYVSAFFVRPRLSLSLYLRLTVTIPALGVLFSLPWLLHTFPLLGQIDVHERQFPQMQHIFWLFSINGGWVPLAALFGVWWAARRRHWLDVWSLTWLLPIVEISSLGNLDALSRRSALDPLQIMYPLGVAWHATIVPLSLLAACGLRPLGEWMDARVRWQAWLSGGLAVGLAGCFFSVVFARPIVAWSKAVVPPITGAVASPADVDAYRWLRANSPTSAKVLNYPGRYEGQWAPVIAERGAVYVRDQLFYIGAGGLRQRQQTMAPAFLDPASEGAHALMHEHGIDYVVVPQWLNRPEVRPTQFRWREPERLLQLSRFSDAEYLVLVADFDGAQIWQLKDSSFGSE